jgi:hypothetical protein
MNHLNLDEVIKLLDAFGIKPEDLQTPQIDDQYNFINKRFTVFTERMENDYSFNFRDNYLTEDGVNQLIQDYIKKTFKDPG